jgi:hypothetical protein
VDAERGSPLELDKMEGEWEAVRITRRLVRTQIRPGRLAGCCPVRCTRPACSDRLPAIGLTTRSQLALQRGSRGKAGRGQGGNELIMWAPCLDYRRQR